MPIPKFLQSCFASYDVEKLDSRKDKKLIITEILNKGVDRDVNWLYRTYSKEDIKEAVEKPTRGMWLKTTYNYWLKILGVDLPVNKFQEAIIDLNPR